MSTDDTLYSNINFPRSILEYRVSVFFLSFVYAHLGNSSIAASRASKDGSGAFHMFSSSSIASMAALMASKNCVSHMSSSSIAVLVAVLVVASGS